jgi:hypothetical protein
MPGLRNVEHDPRIPYSCAGYDDQRLRLPESCAINVKNDGTKGLFENERTPHTAPSRYIR